MPLKLIVSGEAEKAAMPIRWLECAKDKVIEVS